MAGTNPSMLIRIAANLEELKKNLKEGRDQIETTTAAMSKIAASFQGDKLIQQAHNVAAAVNQVGGASKLTAAEQERVNAVVGKALEKYRALGKDAPAALRQLHDETKKTHSAGESWSQWLGKANNLLGVFGVGLSVSALVSFGKALLSDADALVKMNDRTGISIEGLQRLQIAGDDAGNTVDEMANAINQMQDRLAGGDKSAAGALATLNLNLEQFKTLTPDQQFMAVSDALRAVEDPAAQVNLAMDLFGKTGSQILPVLKRGFDDVRDAAVGMSEDTALALDDAGDTIERWWRNTKGATAEAAVAFYRFAESGMNPVIARSFELERELERAGETMEKMVKKIPHPASLKMPSQTMFDAAYVANATAALGEQERALEKSRKEAEIAAEKYAQLRTAAHNMERAGYTSAIAFQVMNAELATLNIGTRDAVPNFNGWRESVVRFEASARVTTEGLEKLGESVPVPQFDDLARAMTFVGPTIDTTSQNIETFGEKAHKAIGDVADILDNIPGKFAEIGSVAARTGQAIMANLGEGNVMGAVVAGVTGVATVIGKLFGNNEEKKINPVRQGFIDAAGGLEELNQKAVTAGVTLTALLDAKNPKQYEAAIKDLTKALEFQDESMKFLDDTVKKYGLSIEELGPAFAQQKLTAQAGDLLKEFRALEAAGVDVGTISDKMSGSINEYLHNAMKTGAEVPLAFKEIANQLVNMGLLTDENGVKIEDLEKSGLTFASTMDEKFGTLVDTIKELVEAISRGLGTAIANVPAVHVPVVYDDPGFTPEGVPGFAHGSGGLRDFGTGTPVVLHGKEEVRTEAQVRQGEAGVAQLAREIREMRRDLPRAIGVALQDALALAR